MAHYFAYNRATNVRLTQHMAARRDVIQRDARCRLQHLKVTNHVLPSESDNIPCTYIGDHWHTLTYLFVGVVPNHPAWTGCVRRVLAAERGRHAQVEAKLHVPEAMLLGGRGPGPPANKDTPHHRAHSNAEEQLPRLSTCISH